MQPSLLSPTQWEGKPCGSPTGTPMNPAGRNQLLGVGCGRSLYKLARGEPDRRCFNGAKPSTSLVLHQFFLELYHSGAEHLPETEHLDVDRSISADAQGSEDWQVPTMRSAMPWQTPVSNWDPESGYCQDAQKLHSAQSSVSSLPVRFLHHQHQSDLWWQLRAWWPKEQPLPSWSAFWTLWHNQWRHVLRLRKSSQHSQCSECAKYQVVAHGAFSG